MRSDSAVRRQLVERAGQTFGEPPAVDEQQGRACTNEIEQPRVDGRPDRRRASEDAGPLGTSSAETRAMSSTGTSIRSFSCFFPTHR